MDWPEHELSLWDLVPIEERECVPSFVHMLSRADVSEQLYVRQVCRRHWCGPCEQIRAWRIQHRIKRYLEYHQPQTVWLVTKSVKNDMRLKDAFRSLHTVNHDFLVYCRRNTPDPLDVVTCWIGTYEITYDVVTGYNLHQHALVGTHDGDKLDYALWHTLWDKAAHYPAHLNFVRVWDRERAAVYIGKYIAKGCWGGLSRGRAYMLRNTLSYRNRIVTKHGTAVTVDFPRFYMCCLPRDKHCASGLGGWDTTDHQGEKVLIDADALFSPSERLLGRVDP